MNLAQLAMTNVFGTSSPLLFLDFDGVLHPISGSPPLLEECLVSLSTALSCFDVEIVIASSWREERSFDELAVT